MDNSASDQKTKLQTSTPPVKRRFIPHGCADIDLRLQEEAVLLERIHYRSRSQHRGGLYHQKLEQAGYRGATDKASFKELGCHQTCSQARRLIKQLDKISISRGTELVNRYWGKCMNTKRRNVLAKACNRYAVV